MGASLTILNSTITSNQAIGGANATPTTAVPLAGGALGGGIENLRSSTLTIVNSTLTDNVARGGSSTVGLGGTAVGGGIDNNRSSALTMIDTTVAGNLAVGGTGGSGFHGGDGTGGGLDNSRNSTASVLDSVFSDNQALGGAGGFEAIGGNGLGGGIEVGYYILLGISDQSVLTIRDSSIKHNVAQGGDGGKPRLVGLPRKKLHMMPRRMADEEDVALIAFDSLPRANEGRFPASPAATTSGPCW